MGADEEENDHLQYVYESFSITLCGSRFVTCAIKTNLLLRTNLFVGSEEGGEVEAKGAGVGV